MLPVEDRRPVPVRTILVTIGLVLTTLALIVVLQRLTHVITLLAVALFFAVALSPPVRFL